MRISAPGLAVVLAASLAACATPRHPLPTAQTLPPSYRNARAPEAEAGTAPFRIDFGDAVLAAMIVRANAANTDLAEAAARLAQVRAAERGAAAEQLPRISASARGERRQVSGVPGLAFGPRRLNVFSAGIDASWEADLFGRLKAEKRAAMRDARAAAADLDAVRRMVIGDVARAYVELRESEARLALARRQREAQQGLARLAESRSRAGLANQIDPESATSLAEQADATIAALTITREAALNRLALLAGATPDVIAGELKEGAMPEAPVPPAAGMPAQLLALRPDVARDIERLAAADDRTAARVRDRLPTFSIGGTAGLTSSTIAGLGDPAAQTWSLFGLLAGPVVDFGRRRALADQAAALADERAARLRATLLTAVREVEDALVAVRERQTQRRQLAAASAAATRALSLAQSRTAAGLDRSSSALNAERDRLSVEDTLLQARADELGAMIALWMAVGGPLEPSGGYLAGAGRK